MASPIPWAAPVTIATRFARFISMLTFEVECHQRGILPSALTGEIMLRPNALHTDRIFTLMPFSSALTLTLPLMN